MENIALCTWEPGNGPSSSQWQPSVYKAGQLSQLVVHQSSFDERPRTSDGIGQAPTCKRLMFNTQSTSIAVSWVMHKQVCRTRVSALDTMVSRCILEAASSQRPPARLVCLAQRCSRTTALLTYASTYQGSADMVNSPRWRILFKSVSSSLSVQHWLLFMDT